MPSDWADEKARELFVLSLGKRDIIGEISTALREAAKRGAVWALRTYWDKHGIVDFHQFIKDIEDGRVEVRL